MVGVLKASSHALLLASIAARRSSALAEVQRNASGRSNTKIHDFVLIFALLTLPVKFARLNGR